MQDATNSRDDRFMRVLSHKRLEDNFDKRPVFMDDVEDMGEVKFRLDG